MTSPAGGGVAPSALEHTRTLLAVSEDGRVRGDASGAGYLDLLEKGEVASSGRAQDLMHSALLPRIYERFWRRALGRVAKGPLGPSMEDEHRIARELLRLEPGGGGRVLDLACGTGAFSRSLARVVGTDGLVVAIDVSETMLARAVADTRRAGLDNVAYVRGDAEALPFADEAFDAVCCFAALNLFADPMRALDRIRAVLRPGGRLAILTSAARGPRALRSAESALGALGGLSVFEPDRLREALRARGFDSLEWQLAGVTQVVGARRGAAGHARHTPSATPI